MLQRRAFIRRAAAMAAVLGLDPVRLLRADAPLPLSNAGFNGTGRFREGHMLSIVNLGPIPFVEARVPA